MKIKTKHKKLIPEYKVEEKYFKLIDNSNFRNNQHYVFKKSDSRYVDVFANYTFHWGSRVRRVKKLEIKNRVKNNFYLMISLYYRI